MNRPEKILRCIDEFLHAPIELVIYGRAALALGFANARSEHGATMDVDAIIPADQLTALQANDDFWAALDRTNQSLESEQLYFTHLFSEMDVILRPDWQTFKMRVGLPLKRISLFRPHSTDLVLTKMMREDPLDWADIEFLLAAEPQCAQALPAAIAQARVPDIPEIKEVFHRVAPRVLRLAKRELPDAP